MAQTVQGFMSFLKENTKHLLEDVKLRRTPLVIDASNILRHLKAVVPCEYGGDYDEYARTVCTFCENLRKAEIRAYLFFNGPSHLDDAKMKRMRHRCQQQLDTVSLVNNDANIKEFVGHHDYVNTNTDQLVFRDIARSYDIQMFQPLGCADYLQEMSAYACYLKAPILSANNNFFFYNVGIGGYIPMMESGDPFELSHDELGYFIKVQRYKRERFLAHFAGTPNTEFIEMSFAILRNQETLFKRFLEKGRYGPIGDMSGFSVGANGPTKRMRSMFYTFNFLKQRTAQAAKNELIDALSNKENKQWARNEFAKGHLLCNVEARDVLAEAEMADYLDMKAGNQMLPIWFCRDFTSGMLLHHYFDVMASRYINLRTMIECLSKPSAYQASLEIRRFIYGILLSGTSASGDIDRHMLVVKELTRDGRTLREVDVRPQWTVPDPSIADRSSSEPIDVPSLQSMELMTSLQGEKMFLAMMDHRYEDIQNVTRPRLFSVVVLRYWVSRSDVLPVHVVVILLCVAAIEQTLRRRSALLGGEVTLQPAFIDNFARKMFVSDEAHVLVDRMHRFAELQAILFDAKMVHRLLRQPFSCSVNTENLDQFINSRFFHQMTGRLEKGAQDDIGELRSIVSPVVNDGEDVFWEVFEQITSRSNRLP